MQTLLNESESYVWPQIAPLLDAAMAGLNEVDRRAVVLRFFDGKSMKEVGIALGASEDAAKMRLSRAVEKLRLFFSKRGIVLPAAAFTAAISANSVQAAPAMLAKTATALAFAKGATVSGSTPRDQSNKQNERPEYESQFKMRKDSRGIPKASNRQTLGGLFLITQMVLAANGADQASKEQQPNPLDLLKNVAHARQQIASGEMEFQITSYEFARPQDGTNHIRLKAVFDGERRRSESFDREYRYVLMGPDAGNVTDAKMAELGLDREAAVRAGLLGSFEAHDVAAYDGTALLKYRETDGQPESTTIDDPGKGSSTYGFDPRILGLTPSPSVTDTIERPNTPKNRILEWDWPLRESSTQNNATDRDGTKSAESGQTVGARGKGSEVCLRPGGGKLDRTKDT